MFSIPHLVIIFVVVLVVFGPEKLPELARNLGKILGEFRRATGDLQNTFEGHLRDIERESSIRQTATGPGATIAPPAQTTIAPPKADAVSAPGTVPTDAPHGWTVAPPNASAGEEDGTPAESSTETPGATQADAAHVRADTAKLMPEPLASAPVAPAQGKQGEQDWQKGTDPANAAGAPEPNHEKGSDGGSTN